MLGSGNFMLSFVGVFTLLVVWAIPLLILGWLLSLVQRAVRALESIAKSMQQNKSA